MKPKQYMIYLGGFLILLAITDITGAALSFSRFFVESSEVVNNIPGVISIIITILMVVVSLFKIYCGVKGILEANGKNKNDKYIKIAKITFIISIILVVVKWVQVFTMNDKFAVVLTSTVSLVILYQFINFTKMFIKSRGK